MAQAQQPLPSAKISLTCWEGEVYEPSDDSFALVDALVMYLQACTGVQLPCTVVEVGCGSGYVIASAALALHAARADSGVRGRGCQLLATDVNPQALAAAMRTLTAHQVRGVELVQSDLLSGLSQRLRGSVDLLLLNPPYVPTPDEEIARGGIAAAWAGGVRGRRVIDRLLSALPALLAPRGMAFIVTVAENDPEDILQEAAAAGLTGSVVLVRGADEECLKILRLCKPC